MSTSQKNDVDMTDEYMPDDDDYIEPDNDYVEPEDDYISDEDDFNEIITRGPGHEGDESFDKYCVFGNLVEMNFHQTMQLRSLVEDLPRPPVKEYICTLTKANVNPGEGKMAAEQRKIHKIKVEKAQENLKNNNEEKNNKRKVSRKIKPGMEVALKSPTSEDVVALGTVQEATGGHIQVMINMVLRSTTKLPQAQGRMTILGHAQAHSVPWPKRNVTTEKVDRNWAEIVSHMDKNLRIHSRSDNKRPLTLEEQADISADKTRKKRKSLQEIIESSQVA